jgi:hypothetical protein
VDGGILGVVVSMGLLVLVVLSFSLARLICVMELTELSMEVTLVFLPSCFREED